MEHILHAGLKATPPGKFQKGDTLLPLKILLAQRAKIFKAELVKIFREIAKCGQKKQNFNDFSQKFELFSNFWKFFDQILKLILATPVIITNM
jgi:hypothetical protein